MKIIYTGAQSTGKSTILRHYKDLGYPVITEVVRNLSKQGIKVNEQGDTSGQELIFDTYYDILSRSKNYISDRGLTDVLAYTKYLYDRDRVSQRTLNEQLHSLKIFNQAHSDILYIYFPIEFPVVDDGFRSKDENFREEIDKNILDILINNNIPYLKISGSVEERIKLMNNAMTVVTKSK